MGISKSLKLLSKLLAPPHKLMVKPLLLKTTHTQLIKCGEVELVSI